MVGSPTYEQMFAGLAVLVMDIGVAMKCSAALMEADGRRPTH